MDKSVLAFINKVKEDDALAGKMAKITNPDEAYAVAKENGVTVSFDEFKATMEKVNSKSAELSEADVDAMVGGSTTTEIVSAVTSAAGAAAAFAAV